MIDTGEIPDDEHTLLVDVSWLLMRLAFSPNSAAFEDRKSSGNLRLIRNPELRNRMQRYSLAIARSAESIPEDGRSVDRASFPSALVQSPVFGGLLTRVEVSDPDGDLLPRVMDPRDVVALLHAEPETMREWLRRRQLHAAFVIGETRYRLTNQTLPMLADVQDERAGRPLAPR